MTEVGELGSVYRVLAEAVEDAVIALVEVVIRDDVVGNCRDIVGEGVRTAVYHLLVVPLKQDVICKVVSDCLLPDYAQLGVCSTDVHVQTDGLDDTIVALVGQVEENVFCSRCVELCQQVLPDDSAGVGGESHVLVGRS